MTRLFPPFAALLLAACLGPPPDAAPGPLATHVSGCSDGTREGVTSLTSCPDIAACSGGWTVPGVTASNDVFGCGNLGVQLQADKQCGVLTRALAPTRPGTCGFKEAEPNPGPWQCLGGVRGDLHEGALVTKRGCAGGSCQWNGAPVDNADKGGVLCCRD